MQKEKSDSKKITKRDFIVLTAGVTSVIGAASFVWPLIDSLNPAADVLALSSIEVDISKIPPGGLITVKWRGKPVFIRHRTEKEIDSVRNTKSETLKDPQEDKDRVKKGKEEWLVLVGICTHLGCVPGVKKGEGWFCPCHGSFYDMSGRIVKGPAPKNMVVPEYAFINNNILKIG